jgi:hypothetical protein
MPQPHDWHAEYRLARTTHPSYAADGALDDVGGHEHGRASEFAAVRHRGRA